MDVASMQRQVRSLSGVALFIRFVGFFSSWDVVADNLPLKWPPTKFVSMERNDGPLLLRGTREHKRFIRNVKS